MDSGNEKSADKPKWLKKIQENSWEAEILISGGALFSLFQLLDWLTGSALLLKEIARIDGTNEIFIFLNLAINGLVIGFVSHLVARSFWISLVCLNHAFPDGIRLHRLRFQPFYQRQAEKINFTYQLIELDKLSGLVFWSALSFVLFVLGIIITSSIFWLIASINLITWNLEGLMLIFYLIFLFDLFSAGLVRRLKYIEIVFRPIYIFFNYASLAFIFRPWFQVLFTNVRPWSLYLIGVVFLSCSLGLTLLTSATALHWKNPFDARRFNIYDGPLLTDNFYENRSLPGHVAFASIQQDIVSDRYLKLFIPYLSRYDELTDDSTQRLSDLFAIILDDSRLPVVEWMPIVHGTQQGITTYLDISSLQPGRHMLKIELKGGDWPFPLQIPFWKQ